VAATEPIQEGRGRLRWSHAETGVATAALPALPVPKGCNGQEEEHNLEARAERTLQEEEDDEEAELERSKAAARAERTRQEEAELERSEAAARAERTRQEEAELERSETAARAERSEAAARAERARQEEALTVSETGVATAAPIPELQSTSEPIPEVQSTVQSTLEPIPEGGRGRRAASACVLSSPCLNQLVVRWEARRVRRYRPRSAPPPGSMRVPSFSTRPHSIPPAQARQVRRYRPRSAPPPGSMRVPSFSTRQRSIPLEGSGGQEGIPPEPPPGLTL